MDEIEWMDARPEALKDAPYFKASEDGTPRTVAQLVSDVTNAAKVQGNLSESHIRKPSTDAAQADIDAFRESVLKTDTTLMAKPEDHSPVPTEADGYKDPTIEGFDQDTAAAKTLALANKWSQTQYEGFVTQMAADHKSGVEGRTTWLANQTALLTEKLGAAKADHIARTVAALTEAHPDVATSVNDGSMDANVVLAIDALVHKMLEMGGEEGEFNSQAGQGGRSSTPSEATAKCKEIREEMMVTRQSLPRYAELQANLLHYTALSRTH